VSRPLSSRIRTAGAALVLAGCLSLSVATAVSARSTSSNHPAGDANSGDVWLDNVGQPAGPGHEMDPHLACADINLWGAGLADSGGPYTVDGWPPSGGQEVVHSSTWSYDTAAGGTQVISVIPVTTLIREAVANGDAPRNGNGFHFKLDLSQDPQKHKVFWVDCPTPPRVATSAQSTPSPTPSPTPAAAAQTSPAANAGVHAAAAPSTAAPSPNSTASAPPSGAVLGLQTTAPSPAPRGGVEAAVSPSGTPLTGAQLPLLLGGLLILWGLAFVAVARRAREA
jgi:hypothetical protein